MATEMLQRRGTAAEWAALNPVLDDGELGFERDTGIIKIGDGVTAWNDIITAYVRRDLVDAAGDLLVGSAANTVARLPKGNPNQRLTVLSDGTVAWADLPAEDNPLVVIDAQDDLIVGAGPDAAIRLPKGANGQLLTILPNGHVGWADPASQFTVVDAKGDLIVGTADNAVARLARGATGQRLTVNADGSLGWTNMPDLSGYETIAHAQATYETLVAGALEETIAHAAATYRPLGWNVYVEKPSDTSRTNNVLQINDPDLTFPVAANTTWIFESLLFVDGSGGDINIQINGPAGADVAFAGAGAHNTAATGSNATGEWVGRASGAPNAAAIPFGTVSGSRLGIHLRGRMKVGATAGNLTINWAQLTAGGVATTIVAGSFIEGRRVI